MAKKTARQAPRTSAAPGTKDAAGKKGPKVEKIDYPGLWKEGKDGEDPTRVRLSAIPADHDPKKHKPLKKTDFENEADFLELKARGLDEKSAALRKEADAIRKMGNVKDRAKAKKLMKMQSQITTLSDELAAAGVDVKALMASLQPKEEKPEEKTDDTAEKK